MQGYRVRTLVLEVRLVSVHGDCRTRVEALLSIELKYLLVSALHRVGWVHHFLIRVSVVLVVGCVLGMRPSCTIPIAARTKHLAVGIMSPSIYKVEHRSVVRKRAGASFNVHEGDHPRSHVVGCAGRVRTPLSPDDVLAWLLPWDACRSRSLEVQHVLDLQLASPLVDVEFLVVSLTE